MVTGLKGKGIAFVDYSVTPIERASQFDYETLYTCTSWFSSFMPGTRHDKNQ